MPMTCVISPMLPHTAKRWGGKGREGERGRGREGEREGEAGNLRESGGTGSRGWEWEGGGRRTEREGEAGRDGEARRSMVKMQREASGGVKRVHNFWVRGRQRTIRHSARLAVGRNGAQGAH